MEIFLVSHFHWDREWYWTAEQFRGRMVDAVDRVLDLLAADPGYRFLLDGQAVVVEDYLAVRPERRDELSQAVRDGRMAVGPWYVQPDTLLPGGESHVRNLLLGRRAAAEVGGASTVGYLPDCFGHPAHMPQILDGFGLRPFVYWRGNGDELAETGPRWRWVAPDGTGIDAEHLVDGYFGAGGVDTDPVRAATQLAEAAARQDEHGPVLLMNGADHSFPQGHTGAVAEALAAKTGATVHRAVLDDFAGALTNGSRPEWTGDLLGGRVANLLPGVWSTRTPQKLRNRQVESLLLGWAEPWAALGEVLGLADERPALDRCWRALVANHAHDSICGCSIDPVHARMEARYDDAEGLAHETIRRVLERLAGLGGDRAVPWSVDQEVAVFNPSPRPRTDVVRIPLDGYPAMVMEAGAPDIHPLAVAATRPGAGFTVDGAPARVVVSEDQRRVRWMPGQHPLDLEVVVEDVPAFGWRRLTVSPTDPVEDEEDDGREIVVGEVRVAVADDGTLDVAIGDRRWSGLLGVEDAGDRGDSYDFDPTGPAGTVSPTSVEVRRARHPSGIQRLTVTRTLAIPAGLRPDRQDRSSETVSDRLSVQARVAPGVPRVDLAVRLEHSAQDHRLRLRFPTGQPADHYEAATTFGVATRSTDRVADEGWMQPSVRTAPHQGWVRAGGLTVAAPGLPEAEVDPDGTILVTLVRAVGWLSRMDLRSRPVPAGPEIPVPGCQVPGPVEARMALWAGEDPAVASEHELGLWGVIAGPEPVLAPGRPLVQIEPPDVLVSTLKPADSGAGVALRLVNPGDEDRQVTVTAGFPLDGVSAVRLDETPAAFPLDRNGDRVAVTVPGRGLRTLLLHPG